MKINSPAKKSKGIILPIIAVGLMLIAAAAMVVIVALPLAMVSQGILPGGGTGTGTIGTGGGNLANAEALTEPEIKSILNQYNSPIESNSAQTKKACQDFHINPLLVLAIANHDSSLGKAGRGRTNRNPGNVKCASHNYIGSGAKLIGCDEKNFAIFETFGDGMKALNWLLRTRYLDKERDTIEKIIPVYAPSSDNNDVQAYINSVYAFMNKHQSGATK